MTTQPLATPLNVRRSQLLVSEVEAVALQLFEERGFEQVTVDEIATAAGISVRTFYRYFPTKDAVLQVQIDRRSEALRAALAARPADEAPLPALRAALRTTVDDEDIVLRRRWNAVISATPSARMAVTGGLQLKRDAVIAEFLGARLGMPSDALVPTMLAGAVAGVLHAVQVQWFRNGGDLATRIDEGLEVLKRGLGWDAPD